MDGRLWVKIGVGELLWGMIGCRNTKTQQNKVRRVKNGEIGHIFNPMAGEISPNITFFLDQS